MEGKLNISYVNTLQKSPDQELNFQALLHMNKTGTLYMQGYLNTVRAPNLFSMLT
jgi:hypothetical protein